MSTAPFTGVRLFFSSSLPDSIIGTSRAERASALLVELVGPLLAGGGALVFGGHPSITPLVHHLITRSARGPVDGRVELHQLRRFEKWAPPQTWDAAVFGAPIVHGEAVEPNAPGLDDELAEMRSAMARSANAALFAGGKLPAASLTTTPGLRVEFERFRATNPDAPVFLTSLLEGYTAASLVPDAEAGRIETRDGLDPQDRAVAWRTTTVESFAAIVLDALARRATSAPRG